MKRLVVLIGMFSPHIHAAEIDIAAANSTCQAVQCVGKQYSEQYQTTINYICKSSGRLAKGIKGLSLNADFYISANKRWMDYMVTGGVVDRDEVSSLWGNVLVVATPMGSRMNLASMDELLSPEVGKVLIGDPSTAPFGRYTKQAMFNAGIWNEVKHKIETKKHITLLAETLKDSPPDTVGVLFATNMSEGLQRQFTVDTVSHEPIRYYSAIVKEARQREEAGRFADYLNGDVGRLCFKEMGFVVF